MKQLEQLVAVAVEQHGPITELGLYQHLNVAGGGLSEALHALKIRGQISRSDAGAWSIKPINGTAGFSPHWPVIEQKETPMADTKKCPTCKESIEIDDFHKSGDCNKCAKKKYNAAYRAKMAGASNVKNHVPAGGRKKRAAALPVPMTLSAERMVVNLFSIRMNDHGGKTHDITIDSTAAKQLLGELQECLR